METSRAETGSSATSSSGWRGQGAGDPEALTLPAGELVGELVRGVAPEADLGDELVDEGVHRGGAAGTTLWKLIASRSMARTVRRGLRRSTDPGRSSAYGA